MLIPTNRKFIPDTCAFILTIEMPDTPDSVSAEAIKNGLLKKEEAHISVVVTKNAKKILEIVLKSKNPEKLKEDIIALADSFPWEYSLTNEYFLHENHFTKEELAVNGHADLPEHTRRSIVQKVNLPDIIQFYEKLDDLLGTALSVPAPHTTLFAWSDYEPVMLRGIGISSKEEFDRYTKKKLT